MKQQSPELMLNRNQRRYLGSATTMNKDSSRKSYSNHWNTSEKMNSLNRLNQCFADFFEDCTLKHISVQWENLLLLFEALHTAQVVSEIRNNVTS